MIGGFYYMMSPYQNCIRDIYKRIEKIKLSADAKEILNTLFLTNSYFPSKNITDEQFIS